MSSGLITITGRTNVGKSSLFNVLTGTDNAIVSRTDGYTLDYQEGACFSGSMTTTLFDTAGLFHEDNFNNKVKNDVFSIIKSSDLVLFVVDASDGLVPLDKVILKEIRKLNSNIVLIINKVDKSKSLENIPDFAELGISKKISISAKAKTNINEVKKEIKNYAIDIKDFSKDLDILIIGKPNVGKSTLTNALLGQNRQMIKNEPGTTKDCIKIPVKKYGINFNVIDSPGIKKKAKTKAADEKITYLKVLKNLQFCNAVIMIIDAEKGITDQDLVILNKISEIGRPCIIAVNKCDLLKNQDIKNLKNNILLRLNFLSYIPFCLISAQKKKNIKNLITLLYKIHKKSNKEFTTSALNKVLEFAISNHQPPALKGKKIKIKYIHQGGKSPIRIIAHGNYLNKVSKNYKKYLERVFREKLKIEGAPIFFDLKN